MTSLVAPLLAAGIDEAPIVFLDVETTGLNAQLGDRVVEIAALRCEGDDIVDALQVLVNPDRRIGKGAMAIHGITDDMVQDAPRFPGVASDLLDLLAGAAFCGHNASFDLGFLAAELSLIGQRLPPLVALCTLRLARRELHEPSYALGNVTQSLGIHVAGQTHRAMTDVLLTRGLFQYLSGPLWQRGVRTVRDMVVAQGGPVATPAPEVIEVPSEICDALADGALLALRYRSEGGQETTRFVRPRRVVAANGHLLLQGFCLLRNDQRTFRLDRIVSMDVVDAFEGPTGAGE